MMNFKLDRCWNLLGDSRRGDKNVNLAELKDRPINSILDALMVADVDLLEDVWNTILRRELGDSLISVLLEDAWFNSLLNFVLPTPSKRVMFGRPPPGKVRRRR
jgi:hypothetical protein